jgi:hypothetical protein
MAQHDRSHDPDDIEALLAEVDQTLQERPASGRAPAARGARAASGPNSAAAGGRLSRAARVGLFAGVSAAVIIGVMFAFVPFVAAWPGAIGAFLGAYGAVFAYGLRRG